MIISWLSRWSDIEKILNRTGPLSSAEFEEGRLSEVQKECNILVIGAGGLGCELLKNLVSTSTLRYSTFMYSTKIP